MNQETNLNEYIFMSSYIIIQPSHKIYAFFPCGDNSKSDAEVKWHLLQYGWQNLQYDMN